MSCLLNVRIWLQPHDEHQPTIKHRHWQPHHTTTAHLTGLCRTVQLANTYSRIWKWKLIFIVLWKHFYKCPTLFSLKFYKNDCIFCKHVTDHPINMFWIPLNLSWCKIKFLFTLAWNDNLIMHFLIIKSMNKQYKTSISG